MYIYIKAKFGAVQPNTCEAPSGVLCPVVLHNLRVPKMSVGTASNRVPVYLLSLKEMMGGENHEILTWKSRLLAATVHNAAAVALQLLSNRCCSMALFFF